MLPTRTLPEGYALRTKIDLSRNKVAVILLNLAGIVLLFGFGYLFLRVAWLLRPELAGQTYSFSFGSLFELLLLVLGLLALSFVLVVLHEAVHGLFFWRLTGDRPAFAFKGAYAYAAAPGWYLPRNPYLWVGLSPLVVLSLLGWAAILILPPGAFNYVLAFTTLNAAGATGDLLVVILLLVKYPRNCLVNDSGDAVAIYTPQP